MTVGWPPPAPTVGESWQLGEVGRLVRTGQTDSTGVGRVTFLAVDAGRRVEITRAVVTCAGVISPEPSCRFYVVPAGADPDQRYEVSGTDSGLFDEADYPGDGLWVLEGEQLLAVWDGAPVSQAITVNLQTRVMVRG